MSSAFAVENLPPCWDPWLLWETDGYHLFYLSGRTDQEPWWKTSWICHARSSEGSSNIGRWCPGKPLLEPLADHRWESGRIFAGSAFQDGTVRYLFYSAASKDDISREAIGVAVSTDGQHWRRQSQPLLAWEDAAGIVSKNGVGYAGRCNWMGHLHWRDPYGFQSNLFQPASDSAAVEDSRPSAKRAARQYYLFFCASLTGSGRYQGGLGVAAAEHPEGPYRILPPAAGPGIGPGMGSFGRDESEDPSISWPFYHLERPQVIYFQRRYHLFFSCFKAFVNPHWLAQVGPENVSDSTLYWFVSDQLAGPYQPVGDLPVVPRSDRTGLYGTTLYPLHHNGDWQRAAAQSTLELAVLGWYAQDYRLAVSQEFKAIWSETGMKIVANVPPPVQ